jgi:hypothetical protein
MTSYHETRIQFRRGTANEWSSANPTLGAGEPGYDTDNGILKIGTGDDDWNALSAFSSGGSSVHSVADISLTGSYDNWTPSSTADTIQITSTSLSETFIRGIDSSYSKKHFTVVNKAGGTNSIVFIHNALNANAGNKINSQNGRSENIEIFPGEQIELTYDSTNSVWKSRKYGVQSNVKPVENKYNGAGTAVVSGVFNVVVCSQDTYDNQSSYDPNTLYFVQ